MTIHIIGTGDTAEKWNGIGPSIGVNDAYKFGHPLSFLILVNTPNQFQHSRLEIIKKTVCKEVYTNSPTLWSKFFGNIHELYTRKWSGGDKLSRNYIYHSRTSPFVGLSLAHSWGFNNLVMWGVDMMTHHKFGKGTSGHFQEVKQYLSFIHTLKQHGTKVSIGCRGTVFDDHLPVWDKEKVSV
jgi:hypothetical protein